MFYYTEFEGNLLQVEIIQNPTGATYVRMPDGREMQVDYATVLGEELITLLVDNQSHEVHVEPINAEHQYEVSLDGQMYQVKVLNERQYRLATLAPRQNLQTGEAFIKAPMPGLVTTVNVEVGQEVEKGQCVIVLEAMKMQNELRAPHAGTIKVIHVHSGQTVEQNKVLAVIE